MCKLSLLFGLPLLALSASLLHVESQAPWLSDDFALALVADGSQEQIEAVGRQVRDRLNQRRDVTVQVLERKLSLVEAAARFLALSRGALDRPLDRVQTLPGDTLEEKLCRQVLLWAETHASEFPPSQGTTVLDDLHNELAALLRQGNGKIVLPEL